jgi:hypothetical protein
MAKKSLVRRHFSCWVGADNDVDRMLLDPFRTGYAIKRNCRFTIVMHRALNAENIIFFTWKTGFDFE